MALNQDKLFSSIALISNKCPLVFAILTRIKILESREISTACIKFNKSSKRYNILLNADFISDLNELNLAMLLEHEILHLAFCHLDVEYSKNFIDKKLANVVFDAIINETCSTMQNKSLMQDKIKSGVFYESIQNMFNVVCEGKNSLEIYREIVSKQKQEKNKGKGGGKDDSKEQEKNDEGENSLPENFDETIQEEINDDSDTENQDAIKEAKQLVKSAINDLTEKRIKNFGLEHGELARILNACKEEKFNAKHVLSRAFERSLRSSTKNTWKKASRRFDDEKGRQKNKVPNVLLLIDTSGSMTDEILNLVAFQCNELLKLSNLTICWGDTELCGHEKYTKGKKFNPESVSGGGGTDLNFYTEVKGKFDLVVFFTDGYINTMQKTKVKKLFIIQKGGQIVPNEENIKLE